ncbi:MAG: phosphoribosylglycinamide formyltransferase [Clostridia bacterium]|nr:phosphoribosylglycinamide formyltransferase [Clostridia bacterium]
MLKTKIAVLVSGGGTNLQALIDAQTGGAIKNGEISLVISNKENAYALERARNNNIKALYIKKDENFEKNLIEQLEKNEIQLIVLAGFLVILSQEFVKRFPNRIINIHPSLIPSFCGDGFYGLKVHEAALKRGVKITGATTHFVNEITDGGEIIMQKAVEIKDGDTPEILQKRVMEEAEWKILPLSVEKVSKQILENI